MTRSETRLPRLFTEGALAEGVTAPLAREQAHYLINVLRLSEGADILAFNGRDGEWRARLSAGKKSAALTPVAQVRPQTAPGAIHYAFAPLKHARLDYMVQKATEMGAASLTPVITQHTQVTRVNADRMRANAVEAAEQCGLLHVPDIHETVSLQAFLAARSATRLLIFCDEEAPVTSPAEAFTGHAKGTPADVLIGPEGGFSADERKHLLTVPGTVRLSLGPRILRADTAAVAALAAVQSAIGDWD